MPKDQITIEELPQDLYELFLGWESNHWAKGRWVASINPRWGEAGKFYFFRGLIDLVNMAEARHELGPLAVLAEAGMTVIVLNPPHPSDNAHLN